MNVEKIIAMASKRTFSFYIPIGLDIGTAIGILSENIPAGICIGIALGIVAGIIWIDGKGNLNVNI